MKQPEKDDNQVELDALIKKERAKKTALVIAAVLIAPVWLPPILVILLACIAGLVVAAPIAIPVYLIRYAVVGNVAQRKAADAIKSVYAAHDTNKVIGVDGSDT